MVSFRLGGGKITKSNTKKLIVYAGLGLAGYYVWNSYNNGAVGTAILTEKADTTGTGTEEEQATGDTFNLPTPDLSPIASYFSGNSGSNPTKKEISSSSTSSPTGSGTGPIPISPESTSSTTSSTSSYASAKKDYSGIDPSTLSKTQKEQVQGQILTDIIEKPLTADPLASGQYETNLWGQLGSFGPVDSGKSYEEVFGTGSSSSSTKKAEATSPVMSTAQKVNELLNPSNIIKSVQETSKKSNSWDFIKKATAITNPITAIPTAAKMTEEQLIKLTTNNPLSFNVGKENTPQKETATAVSNFLSGGASASIVGPTTNPLNYMPEILPIASASASDSSSSEGIVSKGKSPSMTKKEKETAQGQIMTAIIESPAASFDVFSASQNRTDLYNQLNALGPVDSGLSYNQVFGSGSSASSSSTSKKAAAATPASSPAISTQKSSTTSSNTSSVSFTKGNSALAKYNRAAAAASKKKK